MSSQNAHPNPPTTIFSVQSLRDEQPDLPSSPPPLGSASNLAKLLPTGTVLVFETLITSFSNDGSCFVANKVLTWILLASCTISCLVLSLTDSFVATTVNGEKICHGIATLNGFYIFNRDDKFTVKTDDERLKKYKIRNRDYLHMFLQVAVFWVVALSDMNVQECIISTTVGDNWKEVMKNLPIGVGVVGSVLFTIFPTRRRGIGYSDMKPSSLGHPSANREQNSGV